MKKIILASWLVAGILFQATAQNPQAKDAYKKAYSAFQGQKYDKAADLLKIAIDESPDFFHAVQMMAETQKRLGNERLVQKYYEQAVTLNPQETSILYNLSNSYLKTGNPEKAKSTLKRLLAVHPGHVKAKRKLASLGDSIDTNLGEGVASTEKSAGISSSTGLSTAQKNKAIQYANKGISSYNMKLFKDATTYFEEALKINDTPNIRALAGRAYLHINQPQKAIPHLENAVQKEFESGEYHYYLAEAYSQAGQSGAASKHKKIAAANGFAGSGEKFNSVARGFYNQGVEFASKKQYTQAVGAFQRAIEADPNQARYYYNLAYSLYGLKRYEESQEALITTLELEPTFYRAQRMSGDMYFDNKKYKKALTAYADAKRNGDTSVEINNYIGYCYENLGDFKKALASFRIALEMEPDNFMNHYYVANMLHRLNRYSDAIAEYEKTLTLNPDHKATLLNMVGLLGTVGKFERALELGFHLIELDPNDGESYFSVGYVYGEMGDPSNRDKYKRKAKSLGYNPEFWHLH